MQFNNWLEEYMTGKIDANKLYEYITQYFNELISKHSFRELEYLKIYPFISGLQDADIYNENILKEEIEEISKILNGQKAFLYDLWIKLEKCEINQVRQIWTQYKEKGGISLEDFELLNEKILSIVSKPKTIEDICWEKLLTLLKGLPTLGDDFYTYNLLYTKEVNVINIYDDVERLMDILEGERPVHILLRYMYTNFGYTIL